MAETTKFGRHIQDWMHEIADWCKTMFVLKKGNNFGNSALIEDDKGNITGSAVSSAELATLEGMLLTTDEEKKNLSPTTIRVQLDNKVELVDANNPGLVLIRDKDGRCIHSEVTSNELWQLNDIHTDVTVQAQIDGLSGEIAVLRGLIGDVGEATQFNAANMVLVTDANKAATTSSISTTKLGYLTDVTSNIQSQINGKCPKTLSTGNRVVITDASGNITISTALTDPSKLQYLSGVTGDIQTQLNNKAPSNHTSNTTLHVSTTERSTWNAKQDSTLATANAVVVTDANKKILASTTITTTELGYLDGVTSSVQTQLNGKAPSSHVGDSTHITSTERTNWNAASSHVSDTTKHITTTERSTWNAKSNLYVVEGTYTCSGDQNNTVVYVTHGKSVTPKMVFAYMESYTRGSGGDDDMAATGPVTLFVFATVPMESGTASKTKIALLIPDVTTSSQTKIHWTALF